MITCNLHSNAIVKIQCTAKINRFPKVRGTVRTCTDISKASMIILCLVLFFMSNHTLHTHHVAVKQLLQCSSS